MEPQLSNIPENKKPETKAPEEPVDSSSDQKLKLENLLRFNRRIDKQAKEADELNKPHKFWDTQPVLHKPDEQAKHGSIDPIKKVEEVRKQPYKLPEGFTWCEIDVNDADQLSEFYTLLTENYVEDDDNSFRFDYSREFLKWALTPPNYQKNWIVGVRCKGKLFASITGVPVLTMVEEDKLKMAEINFLCVHKTIRDKRLAPVLIMEVTRRVNLRDKWQAIYTAGRTLPLAFTKARYWHRSLNPKKLVDVRFSGLGQNQTKARLEKFYALPTETTIPGLRPMTKKDVFAVAKLYNQGLEKYVVKFKLTQEQVKHYFMPIPNVIYTYVVQKDKEVTDFLSFYSLPSHVMKHEKHKILNACYSFYNFANTVKLQQLIYNALILAKKQNFDVYNCLDLMENASVFEPLHFMVGDGYLNYYLFNWNLKKGKIQPNELAVVLV